MTPSLQDPSIRRRFSAAAPSYDQFAGIQRQVADDLLASMRLHGRGLRILEAGCGTGYLTRQLAVRFPDASIEAIDVSAEMVARARQSSPHMGGVDWRVSDLAHFQPSRPFDVLASSAALHWIEPQGIGFSYARSLLKPGGILYGSLMIHGTLNELREARLRCAPQKKPKGVLPSPQEVRAQLNQRGFQIESFHQRSYRAIYPSAHLLIGALHGMGLTGGLVSRSEIPLNRGELKRLETEYDRSYRDQSGDVWASYEVAFFRGVRLP